MHKVKKTKLKPGLGAFTQSRPVIRTRITTSIDVKHWCKWSINRTNWWLLNSSIPVSWELPVGVEWYLIVARWRWRYARPTGPESSWNERRHRRTTWHRHLNNNNELSIITNRPGKCLSVSYSFVVNERNWNTLQLVEIFHMTYVIGVGFLRS